jgi:hypothetical protein
MKRLFFVFSVVLSNCSQPSKLCAVAFNRGLFEILALPILFYDSFFLTFLEKALNSSVNVFVASLLYRNMTRTAAFGVLFF